MGSNHEGSSAVITEIKRFATHDGPGIRTTIFLKGCPLRCKWCSNPETWKPSPEIYFIARKCRECGQCLEACPENAISMDKEHKIERNKCTLCMQCVEACKNGALQKVGTMMTPEQVAEKVEEDRPFYLRSGGGVTASGGEPLFWPDFTARLFEICHEKNVSTAMDTSGYGKREDVEKVLEHTDIVLLDLKHMSPAEHKKWTGESNDIILDNARLMARKCEVRVSLPLVPGVNDSEENLTRTAEFMQSLGINHIDIEPLHRLGESKYEFLGRQSPFSCFQPVTEGKLSDAVRIVESCGIKATKGRMIP